MHCYLCYWYVCSSLKSVLGYKFLVLDAWHPDTVSLREQECEYPNLFFESKRCPRAKKLGKHWFRLFVHLMAFMFWFYTWPTLCKLESLCNPIVRRFSLMFYASLLARFRLIFLYYLLLILHLLRYFTDIRISCWHQSWKEEKRPTR